MCPFNIYLHSLFHYLKVKIVKNILIQQFYFLGCTQVTSSWRQTWRHRVRRSLSADYAGIQSPPFVDNAESISVTAVSQIISALNLKQVTSQSTLPLNMKMMTRVFVNRIPNMNAPHTVKRVRFRSVCIAPRTNRTKYPSCPTKQRNF